MKIRTYPDNLIANEKIIDVDIKKLAQDFLAERIKENYQSNINRHLLVFLNEKFPVVIDVDDFQKLMDEIYSAYRRIT